MGVMKEGVLQAAYLGEAEVPGTGEEEVLGILKVVVVGLEIHARHPQTSFCRHRTRWAPDIPPPSPAPSLPLSSFPPEQQAPEIYSLSQPTNPSQ
jgi:hypothetical protein